MTENLDIVYLYGNSPRDGAYMDTLIPLIKTQSTNSLKVGIVFIHDGVINASSKRASSEQGILLDSINNAVKPINYGDLVDILDSSEKVISWM